jgi:3-hydroxyacyl-CoA dehydrogenase/enoyl-CoA hydratase/3-hydroxybutyryl-CoA epimerase
MTRAWSLSVSEGIGNLVFDDPSSEINTLSSENLKELDGFLDQIASRSDLSALLLSSGKNKMFIAGADIKEIDKISASQEAFEAAERGKRIFDKLEKLKIPTVCVIGGPCLGGGYELALACRYRAASFSPAVKIGLPEVNLGILPGFGGSVRLPRLVGLLKALPMILAGRVVSAQEALKIGMLDRLFPEQTLLEDCFSLARQAVEGPIRRGARRKDILTRFLEDTPWGRKIVFDRARKETLAKTKGHYPAPFKIIELISQTYGKTSENVFSLESKAFSELGPTQVSKNLIQVFFLTQKYKKQPLTKEGICQERVKKCGVVGAGVMGGGIAHLVSSCDIPVRVKDIQAPALAGALREAQGLYQKQVDRRKLKKHELENKMNLISVGLGEEGLKNCDMILEAVVEDLGIKRKVFQRFSDLTNSHTILASNTSSLPITQIAEGCKDPERVIGLHFFNPVHRMPLVEIIRGAHTSDQTVERVAAFARHLGKTPILVGDKTGFLINRVLLPYMNEAAYLLAEGFSPAQVDAIAEGFGMPMGPVELADQVGLDVAYKVAHILEEAFGQRMKVAPVLKNAMDGGFLGKKSGKGFYEYQGKKKSTNAKLSIASGSLKISKEDALKRMLYVMINEAARCLEEKIADSTATVDIGMILGTGFPPFRGGLLRYADGVGAGFILKDLERFQKETGQNRFEPSPLLKDLAGRGVGFYRL